VRIVIHEVRELSWFNGFQSALIVGVL
jgi:hypothetical protein